MKKVIQGELSFDIKVDSQCPNCSHKMTSVISYGSISLLFKGQQLGMICPKCNEEIIFNLNNIKDVIESLSSKKRSHIYNYISSLPNDNNIDVNDERVTYINNDSSDGLVFVLIIAIIVGVILYFYGDTIKFYLIMNSLGFN